MRTLLGWAMRFLGEPVRVVAHGTWLDGKHPWLPVWKFALGHMDMERVLELQELMEASWRLDKSGAEQMLYACPDLEHHEAYLTFMRSGARIVRWGVDKGPTITNTGNPTNLVAGMAVRLIIGSRLAAQTSTWVVSEAGSATKPFTLVRAPTTPEADVLPLAHQDRTSRRAGRAWQAQHVAWAPRSTRASSAPRTLASRAATQTPQKRLWRAALRAYRGG